MVGSNDLAEITSHGSKVRASKARHAFASNSIDMTAFYAVHQHFVKAVSNKIRRHVYILNKATYVLVASLWEAYCQDIVTEALDILIDYAPTWEQLPRQLTHDIAKEIRSSNMPLMAAWDLAGDGWRKHIKDRQEAHAFQRNYDFSGPKSANVERLFSESLGLRDIRNAWKQAEGLTVCSDLDAHLDRRNNIIHEIEPGPMVNKRDVKAFYGIVRRLVKCTDKIVDDMLTTSTGKSRWTSYVKSGPVEMEDRDPDPEGDFLTHS
jgi:RiboL-PSP-HEPN